MGTNFYLCSPEPLDLICDPDKNMYHIGKRSAGWAFTFRAHTWGCDPGVTSFADWVRVFETVPGARIMDEYGNTYNVVEFCTDVVKPTAGRRNHNDQEYLILKSWNDPEGWAFCDYEFF